MFKSVTWGVILICFFFILSNIVGIDFDSSQPDKINYWKELEQSGKLFRELVVPFLLLNGMSVFIAIVTLVLSIADFKINKEIVSPIAGILLFCAALSDVTHILMDHIIVDGQKDKIISPWLTHYGFPSTFITVGIGALIIRSNNIMERLKDIKKHVLYTYTAIILITFLLVLSFHNEVARTIISVGEIISQSYNHIPLLIYLVTGIFIFPKFHKERKSFFSQALLLSLVPALAVQLHIVFSKEVLDDNHFDIAFIKLLTYCIPFMGLTLDYLQLHKSTLYAMNKLCKRAKEMEQTEVQLQKRSSLYCTLIKNIPNMTVLLFDKNLIVTYADGDVLSDWHVSHQIMTGRFIYEITSDDKNTFPYVEAINGKETIIEREIKDKSYKEHILPIKNNEGNVYAGMSVLQEITEIKQYQKELEMRIEALDRSNKELEQFAYVASHDLQEPLRKIKAFGDRLSGKYKLQLGEDGQNYIERMQLAAGRMQGLIDDLLAFSRLARRLEPFAKTDLSVVVDEVLADLEISIEQKNAKIIVEHLPLIEAMHGQMRHLFQNLISNALKFSKENVDPLITIKSEIIKGKEIKELSKSYKDHKYLKIVVEDNGIGFEEKYLDRIFIIFQRLHGRSEYEGTGIGLAICKKIVENHNGVIIAKSKINEGSSFIIILPFAQYNHEQLALTFKN